MWTLNLGGPRGENRELRGQAAIFLGSQATPAICNLLSVKGAHCLISGQSIPSCPAEWPGQSPWSVHHRGGGKCLGPPTASIPHLPCPASTGGGGARRGAPFPLGKGNPDLKGGGNCSGGGGGGGGGEGGEQEIRGGGGMGGERVGYNEKEGR